MDRTKAAEILHKAKVCYATEYLDCHMVCDMCKYHVEDSLVVEAIDTAIKALDKDIDVPSKSALDHIHNVVKDDAYKRGYEQGKKEAIPVDWLDSYITNHSHGEIVFESIGMMYIRAMIEQWRKEQNGKTD